MEEFLSVNIGTPFFCRLDYRCVPTWKTRKMSEESLTKSMKRFDGTNFQLWKFQMISLLIAQDIYDVVNGDQIMPVENATNAAQRKAWTKDNARAMFLISVTIEYSQLTYLTTCTSAREMWKKMSAIHEQKTASNKLLLLQKFHEYKMDPNDSVVHVAKIQNMTQQLSDLDEGQTNSAIMAKILGSLPNKYRALITAWDSVAPAAQTIQSLQERLIKEERRLLENDAIYNALAVMMVNEKKKVTSKNQSGAKDQQRSKNSDQSAFITKRMDILQNIAEVEYVRKRTTVQRKVSRDREVRVRLSL